MSIVRTEHNKSNPYVMLNKSVLENPKLSWEAKGLWGYLMSRPDNWKISVPQLSKIYEGKGGGEKAIYSILNELIKEGYCTRIQTKGKDGCFNSYEYTITEFKKCLPHSPQGDAADRDAGKGDTNKEGELNKERKQQQPAAAAAVFSCLEKEKRISKRDWKWFMKFEEVKVQSAIKYANDLSQAGKINKSFSATVKWILNENPEIDEIVDVNDNKLLAEYAANTFSSKTWKMETLNFFVSFYPNGGNCEGIELKYDVRGFKEKLLKILKDNQFKKLE